MSYKEKINKQPKILVIGDLILDQYFWTDVNRISPEAPVPVCHVQNTTYCLGGAGNVANNLSSFGAQVTMASLIGNDENANLLMKSLFEANINHDFVIGVDNITTICKTRVLAKGQQLCRIDHEAPINEPIQIQQLISQLNESVKNADVVVLSDYGKGVIGNELASAVISLATTHQIPVIVDPKGDDPSKYAGATYVTPNLSEFKQLTNLADTSNLSIIDDHAKKIISNHAIKNILLTRSADGMSLINETEMKQFSTKAVEVFDVSGAGDTVVAALAFGLGNGWTPAESIEFANIAAGIVVSKVGTATTTISEIDAHESHL